MKGTEDETCWLGHLLHWDIYLVSMYLFERPLVLLVFIDSTIFI